MHTDSTKHPVLDAYVDNFDFDPATIDELELAAHNLEASLYHLMKLGSRDMLTELLGSITDNVPDLIADPLFCDDTYTYLTGA